MILDRVTITGADDSVKPAAVLKLSAAFPFVEWGILVSHRRQGGPRFPSRTWVQELLDQSDDMPRGTSLSLHVCGRWVRQFLRGFDSLLTEWGEVTGFRRIQLNTHAEPHQVEREYMLDLIRAAFLGHQIIVQMDGTDNGPTLLRAIRESDFDAVPLFDTSGGAGIVAKEWPHLIEGVDYHGYAGGLGPENVLAELWRIKAAAGPWGDRVWIDMERRVRSEDDARLDLDKVRAVLEACAPLVQRDAHGRE